MISNGLNIATINYHQKIREVLFLLTDRTTIDTLRYAILNNDNHLIEKNTQI